MPLFPLIADTFLYLPETVWQAMIAAIVTLVLAKMAHTANASAKSAATKVEEVKEDLKVTSDKADAKTDAIADVLNDVASVGQAVHVLVNSNMAAQLKISTIALKRLAELTKHPDDVAAYQLSQKLYSEHEKKQATVDGKDAK